MYKTSFISIRKLCGTDSIPRSTPGYSSHLDCGEYPGILRGILSIPHKKAVDLSNVMYWVLDLLILAMGSASQCPNVAGANKADLQANQLLIPPLH